MVMDREPGVLHQSESTYWLTGLIELIWFQIWNKPIKWKWEMSIKYKGKHFVLEELREQRSKM